MLLGKVFTAILRADTAITNVVNDRITPQLNQQATEFPRIIYVADDISPVQSYAGPSALTSQMVTVACVAEDYPAADSLGNLVRKALDNEDGVFAGIRVSDISYVGEREGTATLDEDPEFVLYTKELDFKVWFYMPA